MGKSDLLCLRIFLKHREIVDITETVCILLDQIQLLTEFVSDHSSVICSAFFLICHKENCIANFKSCQCAEFFLTVIRNKLVDWSLVRAVFQYFQIS